MTERILLGTKTAMLHVMVELSATQPDNAIVNYKKTWGLLKARGVKVDEIFHKINFMKKNKDGLVLSGLGAVYISSEGVVSDLFNCNEKVYFAFFNSEVRCNEVFSADNLSDWMNNIWDENGVVFLLMGYLDEADSELVALARKSVLNIFFEVKK